MVSANLVRAVNREVIDINIFRLARKEMTLISDFIEEAVSEGNNSIVYKDTFKVEYPHVWNIVQLELVRMGYNVNGIDGEDAVVVSWE